MKKWLREIFKLEYRTDAGKANLIGFAILAFLVWPLSPWGHVISRFIWIKMLPNEPFPFTAMSQHLIFFWLGIVLVVSVFFVSWGERGK